MRKKFQALLTKWDKSIKSLWSFIILFSFSSSTFASEPKPWQMDLQEPSGIIAEKATDLHNFLLVVITLISVFVLGLLIYVCIKFREKP